MAMAAMVARGVVQTAQMQMPLVAWVVPAVPLERYPEMGGAVEPGARRQPLREAVTTRPAEPVVSVVSVEPRQQAPLAVAATGALHRQTISLSAVLAELVVRRLTAMAGLAGMADLARRKSLVCSPERAVLAARRSTATAASVATEATQS